jgi:hypothetical protein
VKGTEAQEYWSDATLATWARRKDEGWLRAVAEARARARARAAWCPQAGRVVGLRWLAQGCRLARRSASLLGARAGRDASPSPPTPLPGRHPCKLRRLFPGWARVGAGGERVAGETGAGCCPTCGWPSAAAAPAPCPLLPPSPRLVPSPTRQYLSSLEDPGALDYGLLASLLAPGPAPAPAAGAARAAAGGRGQSAAGRRAGGGAAPADEGWRLVLSPAEGLGVSGGGSGGADQMSEDDWADEDLGAPTGGGSGGRGGEPPARDQPRPDEGSAEPSPPPRWADSPASAAACARRLPARAAKREREAAEGMGASGGGGGGGVGAAAGAAKRTKVEGAAEE